MEELERFNDVKSIGDIMKEWHIDAQSISDKHFLRLTIDQQQKKIFDELQTHIRVSDKFDFIYKKTTDLIINFENFFTDEKTKWRKTQRSLRAWTISIADISKYIERIDSTIEDYEEYEQRNIRDMRSLINFIDTEPNKRIYYKMLSEIWRLFVFIRADLQDISTLYGKYIQILKKNGKK